MSKTRRENHKWLVFMGKSHKRLDKLVSGVPIMSRHWRQSVKAEKEMIKHNLYKTKLGHIPTDKEWKEMTDKIPSETVEISEDGKYDKEKSPKFHDWMVNG